MNQPDIESKALAVVDNAKALRIVDDATCQNGADMLTAIKAIREEIDLTFDPVITAAHKAHKEACAAKKKHEAPLIEAEFIIKGCIGTYTAAQEQARRAEEARLAAEAKKQAEERAMAEAAALEKQGDKETAKAIVEEAIAAPPPVVQLAAPKMSGFSTKQTWAFKVVAPELVPREYMTVDEKKIRKVVQALGMSAKIPGVQVYAETVVSARRPKVDDEVPV